MPAIAQKLGLCPATVRSWLKRFNRRGLAGLQGARRPGRPSTYTPAQVGEVIATSLTKPQDLGLPFASWTLDRLAAYLQEVKGIPIKRSRIDELLLEEGLRWRTEIQADSPVTLECRIHAIVGTFYLNDLIC